MTSAEPSDELRALADAYRIDTDYWDWQGNPVTVSAATLRGVLAAFGVDASTPQSCAAALEHHHRTASQRSLPACLVVRAGSSPDLPDGADVVLEDGSRWDPTRDLPTGYHRLQVGSDKTQLIVTPQHVPWPAALTEPGWGFATQLYSVRSRASWGIGDAADLATLAEWSARGHGADFVLVNPLHAAEVLAPMNPSPYLPTSRRFANPIYLRVEDVAGYAELDPADRARVDELGRAVRGSEADLLDRDAAWAAKLAALALIHAAESSPERADEFAAFCVAEGDDLDRFATWCVLTERHGGDWHTWPAELQDPTSPAVAAFASAEAARVGFFRWLQWLVEQQLDRAQQQARAAGMRLGVLHDLAVGVSPIGADSWSYQHELAREVRVGAPPDAYSQRGQDWQQPPWRPDRLAELAYAPLRDLFRAALRHGGGLRIDHIIGLFRLWWIPAGRPALEGTYVHYDHEAIIGILALEAERAGAVIIGEDLGNVEPWVHGYLDERGLLGTSILWFESDRSAGGPLPPQRWRRDCLASVTTHDLPPTTGYLAGDHIRLRDRLGLLTRSLDDEAAADRDAQDAWIARLRQDGLLDSDDPEAVVVALHRFLTRTPARLRCAALTDAVGERRTQNQPGTVDEYPNWRIPLGDAEGRAVWLDDIVAHDLGAAIADAIR